MIRSTIPTFYTLRSREKAIIEIAITNWRYEPMNERYVATVEDYAIITDENGERKQQFNSKEVYYTNTQIDQLFIMIADPIEVGDSYSNKLVNLIAQALLYVTKTDLYEDGTTIHGLQPNDWVISSNYIESE